MSQPDLPAGWELLSPAGDDRHYFFGYYDRQPWNAEGRLHLALRVGQAERLPETGERAEIGVIDRDQRRFEPLTTTRAWCHQQGAMTLWLNHRPDCFVYNDWDEDEGKLVARVYSLADGLVGRYERPIYAMSPDGRWAASLTFARIPRRGYSYADATLDTSPLDLDGDGIVVLDLHTGDSRLAVSYRQMLAIHPMRYTLAGKHSWLNHIIFNCDSTRLLFLLRHCQAPESDTPWPWLTHMYTANVDGSDLLCPLPAPYWFGITHQIWGRTPREVLVDANWQHDGHQYVVFDERTLPLQGRQVSAGLGPAGHLVFSPDGSQMLADTYPREGVQRLALIDCASGELEVIGTFRHQQPEGTPHDVRCDLHPRWSAAGGSVTVDSIHLGPRAIFLRDLP